MNHFFHTGNHFQYIHFRNTKYCRMLEIGCFEITSAETALLSVADRIEFCSGQHMGGLTPDIAEFRSLRSVYRKPIYVRIPPGGGGFLYSATEFREMRRSLLGFKQTGADGFVFRILAHRNNVEL